MFGTCARLNFPKLLTFNLIRLLYNFYFIFRSRYLIIKIVTPCNISLICIKQEWKNCLEIFFSFCLPIFLDFLYFKSMWQNFGPHLLFIILPLQAPYMGVKTWGYSSINVEPEWFHNDVISSIPTSIRINHYLKKNLIKFVLVLNYKNTNDS